MKTTKTLLRKTAARWDMLSNHVPDKNWMWMGDSVEQAAQDMAALLVADHNSWWQITKSRKAGTPNNQADLPTPGI